MPRYLEYEQDGQTIGIETDGDEVLISMTDSCGSSSFVRISDNLAYVIGEQLTRKVPVGYEDYAQRDR